MFPCAPPCFTPRNATASNASFFSQKDRVTVESRWEESKAKRDIETNSQKEDEGAELTLGSIERAAAQQAANCRKRWIVLVEVLCAAEETDPIDLVENIT